MASIFDTISAQAIAFRYQENESNRIPYIGQGFFPSQQKEGLTLEWIQQTAVLPLALQPSAFDAKPLLRGRDMFISEKVRMPFFRESMRRNEQDRQDIMEGFANNPNSIAFRRLIAELYNDANNLLEGARVIPEIMRMGLITSASFTIANPANSGQSATYEYNYDPNGEWAATNVIVSTQDWSQPTSNPIDDIRAVTQQAMVTTDTTLAYMLMGYETFLDLYNNPNIRNAATIAPSLVGINTYPSESAIQSYIEGVVGLRIIVYRKQYRDTDGVQQYFYPQRGQITFLPDSPVGTTWYGVTPEQADLVYNVLNTNASVAIVDTGVAICTKLNEGPPVSQLIWASEIVLPSFERMMDVYNLTYTVA